MVNKSDLKLNFRYGFTYRNIEFSKKTLPQPDFDIKYSGRRMGPIPSTRSIFIPASAGGNISLDLSVLIPKVNIRADNFEDVPPDILGISLAECNMDVDLSNPDNPKYIKKIGSITFKKEPSESYDDFMHKINKKVKDIVAEVVKMVDEKRAAKENLGNGKSNTGQNAAKKPKPKL